MHVLLFAVTAVQVYIHTYKNLFIHAGLNNSELISMRGVILGRIYCTDKHY
jgi:hypothetical protein